MSGKNIWKDDDKPERGSGIYHVKIIKSVNPISN
jgi:hypothetical protein